MRGLPRLTHGAARRYARAFGVAVLAALLCMTSGGPRAEKRVALLGDRKCTLHYTRR